MKSLVRNLPDVFFPRRRFDMHKLLTLFFGVAAVTFFVVGCQTQTDSTTSPATTPVDKSVHNDADGHPHESAVHEDHNVPEKRT